MRGGDAARPRPSAHLLLRALQGQSKMARRLCRASTAPRLSPVLGVRPPGRGMRRRKPPAGMRGLFSGFGIAARGGCGNVPIAGLIPPGPGPDRNPSPGGAGPVYRGGIVGECATCGKRFKVAAVGRPRLYCSARCKEKGKRKRERTVARAAAPVSADALRRACHICGAPDPTVGVPAPLLCALCASPPPVSG